MTRRHRFGADPGRPTFLAFHAHPDDEAIFTGGTLTLARAAGWRTVVVFATGGELGAGPGADHRTVAAARRREAERAGEILGVDAVEFLGFRDSGMAGSTDNRHPGCLAAADRAEAADRLALVLERYAVTALSSYDPRGVYGHPDHVAVHRMARRLHRAGAVGELYEATLDPANLRTQRAELVGSGRLDGAAWPEDTIERLGAPAGVPVALDVAEVLDTKRRSIAAHASQVLVNDFMGIPAGAFERLISREWFLCHGRGRLLAELGRAAG